MQPHFKASHRTRQQTDYNQPLNPNNLIPVQVDQYHNQYHSQQSMSHQHRYIPQGTHFVYNNNAERAYAQYHHQQMHLWYPHIQYQNMYPQQRRWIPQSKPANDGDSKSCEEESSGDCPKTNQRDILQQSRRIQQMYLNADALRRTRQKIVDNYNSQAEVSGHHLKERSKKRTANIRDMNNWLKYVCIVYSIREAFYENYCQKIKVLDLGCGKGGDLYKFRGMKLYLSHYVGVDLAHKCLQSARRKFESMIQDQRRHSKASAAERQRFGRKNAYGQSAGDFFDGELFYADFICNDMMSPNMMQNAVLREEAPFHLLNVQFALHYAFESISSLDSWLETVASCTVSGSFLVCSLVQDQRLLWRLRNEMAQQNDTGNRNDDEMVQSENELQSIKMKKSDVIQALADYEECGLFIDSMDSVKMMNEMVKNDDADYSKLIGIPYTYYQEDSVEGEGDGVEEYLVPFKVLCVMLWRKCKMKLIWRRAADGMYEEFRNKAPYKYGFAKRRNLHQVDWTEAEREVIHTYHYALFMRDEGCSANEGLGLI